MTILLVNNHSYHLDKLRHLLSAHHVIVADNQDNLHQLSSSVDAIVLSGGGKGRPVLKHTRYYHPQTELLRHTTKPVIGICLGAQIIAHSYAADITRLNHKRRGLQTITLATPLIPGLTQAHVFQSHLWAITHLGPQLRSLSYSPDGHQIIKHSTKPIYGLQFHPEVYPTQTAGAAIFKAILRRHAPLKID